jgi:hypothetical protein
MSRPKDKSMMRRLGRWVFPVGLSGTAITSLLTELYAMPKNVIEKAAQAVSK